MLMWHIVLLCKYIRTYIVIVKYTTMNNHIYSRLFKTQERESDRRSKEIEQRKESQNTYTHEHVCSSVPLGTTVEYNNCDRVSSSSEINAPVSVYIYRISSNSLRPSNRPHPRIDRA